MRQTVNVVCAKAPRRIGCVPAVRRVHPHYYEGALHPFARTSVFYCSYCGARVRVVA